MLKTPSTNRPPLLTAADRMELCHRVDFLAVLADAGIQTSPMGDHHLAALRDERTPSTHVYPPGVGRRGKDGWSWHDFGSGKGGDALAFLVDVQGLPFTDAARVLADKTGFWPANLLPASGAPRPIAKPAPLPVVVQQKGRATMEPLSQWKAVSGFLWALMDLFPAAESEGAAYLQSRGVLPPGWPSVAFFLPRAVVPGLTAKLAAHPDLDVLIQAGLMKPAEENKPPRLSWWDDTVLLAHLDVEGSPQSFIGRRLDFKPGGQTGKYIQQTYSRGAARIPFGLPTLYRPPWLQWKPAPARAGDLLLVEGPLDALGAACLGWPALGLSMRPQAHDYQDRNGACARMLEPHLSALRDMNRVRVVPDNDQGDKGAEGEALGHRLVAWLRAAGVRSDLALLSDLCPNLPPDCKDLADAATLEGKP